MNPKVLPLVLVVLSISASISAAPAVLVGHHYLYPDTSGQKITISISGTEEIAGVNLYCQVGDGGPELSDYGLPAGTDGPAITAVDLMPPGGIFTGLGTQSDLPGIPQVANSTLDLTTGTVVADGVLVELTIDTTGFTVGTWDLLLKDVLPFASLGGPYHTTGVAAGGADQAFDITNGSITVPEPAVMYLLVIGAIAVIRKRHGKSCS